MKIPRGLLLSLKLPILYLLIVTYHVVCGEQKWQLRNYAVKRKYSAVPRGWRNPLQDLIECSAHEVSQLRGSDETLSKVSRHRGDCDAVTRYQPKAQ